MGTRRGPRTRTTHPTIEVWVDHVRGVATEDSRRAAEAHLATACPSCGKTVALLQRLTTAARAESQIEVPPEVEDAARTLILHRHPEKIGLWRRLAAALTYS